MNATTKAKGRRNSWSFCSFRLMLLDLFMFCRYVNERRFLYIGDSSSHPYDSVSGGEGRWGMKGNMSMKMLYDMKTTANDPI